MDAGFHTDKIKKMNASFSAGRSTERDSRKESVLGFQEKLKKQSKPNHSSLHCSPPFHFIGEILSVPLCLKQIPGWNGPVRHLFSNV